MPSNMPDFFMFFLVGVVLILWAGFDAVTPPPEDTCNDIDMALMPDQCVPTIEGLKVWAVWFFEKLLFITFSIVIITMYRGKISKRF